MRRSAICVRSTLTFVCTATLTCAPAGVSGQPRQAIEGLAERIQPRDGDRERSLLLGLRYDLINPGPQVEIGAAECLFRWQQRDCGATARRVFHDGVGGAEFEAINPMPMQTRYVQLVVARDLRRRLPGGEAAVNLGPLEMLTCAT